MYALSVYVCELGKHANWCGYIGFTTDRAAEEINPNLNFMLWKTYLFSKVILPRERFPGKVLWKALDDGWKIWAFVSLSSQNFSVREMFKSMYRLEDINYKFTGIAFDGYFFLR